MTRIEVVTARVSSAARAIGLLAPGLSFARRASESARGAASGTEAEGALEGFCQRLGAVAGRVGTDTDALGSATARAAECYVLADEYAIPTQGKAG